MGSSQVGVLVAVLVWRWWIPAAGGAYATLISAVFDTHRFVLYDALCHPRPDTPALEPRLGEALTMSSARQMKRRNHCLGPDTQLG